MIRPIEFILVGGNKLHINIDTHNVPILETKILLHQRYLKCFAPNTMQISTTNKKLYNNELIPDNVNTLYISAILPI
jgi:hypothetical protein